MHGNVWEWTDTLAAPDEITSSHWERVIRGGDFLNSGPQGCTAQTRNIAPLEECGFDDVGFRVAAMSER